MKLKILHVIDTGGPGGAETVLSTIVERLPQDGFISRVIVPYRGWLYQRLMDTSSEVIIVPRRRSPDLPFLWSLIKQFRSFNPDVIHCHLLTSSVYSSVAASMQDFPIVVTFHGMPDITGTSRFLSVKGRLLARSRNYIVFVADHLRRSLQPRLHLPEKNCYTIHNGISFGEVSPSNKEFSSHSNKDGKFLIGTIGNIRPAKDYPTLLRAAAIVRRSFPAVRLVIAGEGSGQGLRDLEDLRDQLGLGQSVRFAGFVEDVNTFIRDLDVYVNTSITEGLPLAIVEAAGLGCPVIATRSGGAEEVLGEAGSGMLVPVGNPDEIATRLIEVISDPESARATASEISADVRNRFGIAQMMDSYKELYHLASGR